MLRPLYAWRVVPERIPRVIRNCHHCHSRTEYASSDMFRVNRNGAQVDDAKTTWTVDRSLREETGQAAVSGNRSHPRIVQHYRLSYDVHQIRSEDRLLKVKVEAR